MALTAESPLPRTRLHLYAANNRSEAEVRSLAADKVRAERAYLALINSPKAGLSEEALADREIAIVQAERALGAAAAALRGAV